MWPTLFAEVDPLTPLEKGIGIALTIAVLSAGVYMLKSRWLAAGEVQQVVSPERKRWRVRTIYIMLLCGVMLFGGLWIDPAEAPRLFIYYWTATLCLVLVLLASAALDLFAVRMRFNNYLHRQRVNQERIMNEHREAQLHKSNGKHRDESM